MNIKESEKELDKIAEHTEKNESAKIKTKDIVVKVKKPEDLYDLYNHSYDNFGDEE